MSDYPFVRTVVCEQDGMMKATGNFDNLVSARHSDASRWQAAHYNRRFAFYVRTSRLLLCFTILV